jgi:hypothetical protein
MRRTKAGVTVVFTLLSAISLWSTTIATTTLSERGGEAQDYFGSAVAIAQSGGLIVVGAPGVIPPGATANQGVAYVFVKEANGAWPQNPTATLYDPAPGNTDESFGASVAISSNGNTIAVGAPGKEISENAEQGAVLVFTKPASGWANDITASVQLSYNGGQMGDNFGAAVAINGSGNTVVAGATRSYNFEHGEAYVFQKGSSGWAATATPTATLEASSPVGGDQFGTSVAILGNGTDDTLAVGASGASTPSECNGCGVVFLFNEPSGGWKNCTSFCTVSAQLYADSLVGGSLGVSVALSDVKVGGKTVGIVAAGAPNAEIGSNTTEGSVFVFVEPSAGWKSDNTPTLEITESASEGAHDDYFGASVAINGAGTTAYLIAGAPYKTVGSNAAQGEAFVFSVNPASATSKQLFELSQLNGSASNYYGQSVSFIVTPSPPTAVIGVPGGSVAFGGPPTGIAEVVAVE